MSPVADGMSSGDGPTESPSWIRTAHYLVVGLLLAGGLAYWATRPPTVNPLADPRAAEAMAVVQTHRAQQAPTILQAVANRVKAMSERGQGVRLGEWTVQRQQDDLYLVRVEVREEGTRQWFEREYLWQVDLGRRTIRPLSMAASDLMPFTPPEATRQ